MDRQRLGQCFGLVASVLAGASVYGFSTSHQEKAGAEQRRVHRSSQPLERSQQLITDDSPQGTGLPVVLPPNVPPATAPVITERFRKRCLEIGRLGYPSAGEARCYGGYVANLNYERRLPNWVLEVVDGQDAKCAPSGPAAASPDELAVSRKQSHFYPDHSVPAAFRVHPNEYATRGLSRGHLAPAQMHKGSQEELDATFNMNANVVPQDMTVNAVDWQRLEELTRKLGKEVGNSCPRKSKAAAGPEAAVPDSHACGKLFVVTGPAFVPQTVKVVRNTKGTVAYLPTDGRPVAGGVEKQLVQYELTGKAGVAVPTHLFKVLVAEKHETDRGGKCRYEAAAFLVPNHPIGEEKPLTAFQVPVERVEQVTGLQFFPSLRTARLPDLCRYHRCDARPAALFRRYRQVAQLRRAESIPELRQVLSRLESLSNHEGAVEEAIRKEYENRVRELAAEAVRSIDDV